MKYIYTIFIAILCYSVNAQDKPYEFIGLLELESKQFISYQIQFTIHKDQSITGVSVSDIMGPDETKSKIIGHVDKKNKTIKIKEDELIYTKSSFDPSIFCNLQFNIPLKKDDYKSKFVGYYTDGSFCIDGKLHLKNVDKINTLYKMILNKVDKLEAKDKLKTEDANKVKKALSSANLVPVKLTNQERLNYVCKKDDINISVWDEAYDDGDEIEIYFNNSLIENVTVSTNKKDFTLKLQPGKNIIEIRAINHGRVAPNTVSFELQNTSNKVEIHNALESGERSFIHIYHEK